MNTLLSHIIFYLLTLAFLVVCLVAVHIHYKRKLDKIEKRFIEYLKKLDH